MAAETCNNTGGGIIVKTDAIEEEALIIKDIADID